jgi:hypothetical protein
MYVSTPLRSARDPASAAACSAARHRERSGVVVVNEAFSVPAEGRRPPGQQIEIGKGMGPDFAEGRARSWASSET